MSAVPYNFAKVRLGGEWQLRLKAWFQAALGLASKAWNRDVALSLEVQFRDIETGRSRDLLPFLPADSFGFRIQIGERLFSMVVVPRPFLLGFIQGMLGDAVTETPADRELTMVEESLAEYLFASLWLPPFAETFPAAAMLDWQLKEREPHPNMSRLFTGDETLVSFYWRFGGTLGEHPAWWIMPKKELEEMLGPIAASTPDSQTAALVAKRVETSVKNLPIEITVLLGENQLSLSDIAALKPGDVLMLNQSVHEPLAIRIGDRLKMRGWACRSGAWQTVQVDSFFEE